MSAKTIIDVHALEKTYAGKTVVHDFNLRLQQGEVLGLLGANGAGKSTTLGMLSGVLQPSRGQRRLMGIEMSNATRSDQKFLGFLPDTPPIYPELTVDEFLQYCAKLRGVPKSKQQSAVAEAKTLCALNAVSKQLTGQLSKGFKQRLGVAQAIVHKPKLLILDEPSAGLDPEQAQAMRKLITQLSQHSAIILSTHLLTDVQASCTRVIILDRGKTVFDDQLSNVQSRAGEGTFILRVKQAVNAADILSTISGIQQALRNQNGDWQLTTSNKNISADQIARQVGEQQWGLEAIYPQQHNLEQIFLSIISGAEQSDSHQTRDH